MKKMRLHIYIVLGVFVIGFILGTFLDLSVTEAIFSRDNGFGLTVAALGVTPGYMILAILGGGYFALALHKQYKVVYKVLMYIFAVVLYGLAVYYSGREIFGVNGFNQKGLMWLGYLICGVIGLGCAYLGYVLTKKSKNENLWLIYAIVAACIFMALVPGVSLIKAIFHRPRYRTLSLYDGINFYPWYKRCGNYKELMETFNLTSEEFKSFPSGHTGASGVFMIFALILPLLDLKYEKLQLPLFYAGFAFCLFVAFTRILVGAHFLSDVSMGGILTSVFMLVNNEVIIAVDKKKKLVLEAEVE